MKSPSRYCISSKLQKQVLKLFHKAATGVVLWKKADLKNFTVFTGKNCWSLFLISYRPEGDSNMGVFLWVLRKVMIRWTISRKNWDKEHVGLKILLNENLKNSSLWATLKNWSCWYFELSATEMDIYLLCFELSASLRERGGQLKS